MLRVLLAILVILSLALGGYLYVFSPTEDTAPERPEISAVKKEAIAKRAVQSEEETLQDEQHRDAVNALERNFKER